VRHELTWNPAGVGGLVIDVGALFERIAATLGTLMR
jgi:hypothetical protein